MSNQEHWRAFVDLSRYYLTGEYLPKLRTAVSPLPPEDVWWRPNEASNSIGNLLLHLTGNLGQWVVAGLGRAPDHRVRDREFAAREGSTAGDLLDALGHVVGEADRVLGSLGPADLERRHPIQGRRVTGFRAVYHVVEHFAMHTGQILLLVKVRQGRDLGFYAPDQDGQVRPRWTGAAPEA
jgi:uncharacterized damage-inducible protein DinB